MSSACALFLGLISVCIVVVIGMVRLYRFEQTIVEKKMDWEKSKKQRDLHFNRYQQHLKEIEHVRSQYFGKLEEMDLIMKDVEFKKEALKPIFEIVAKEDKQFDGISDPTVLKIVDRRKQMVKKHWKSMDRKKLEYLGKQTEALAYLTPVQELELVKNKEFKQFLDTRSVEKRLKREYDRMMEKPIFLFRLKNGRKAS